MRLTINAAFQTFDRLVRRRSAHTRRAYRSDIADFAKWAKAESAGHGLFDLLAGDRIAARRRAEAYRAHLAGRRESWPMRRSRGGSPPCSPSSAPPAWTAWSIGSCKSRRPRI